MMASCLLFEEEGMEKLQFHSEGNKLWSLNFYSYEWVYILYPYLSAIVEEKYGVLYISVFFFASYLTSENTSSEQIHFCLIEISRWFNQQRGFLSTVTAENEV